MLHIVLHQPEIPHNTGAVGRLCLATGARLHLIKPLGFSLDDAHVRRAGLDYWSEVDVRVWESFEVFQRDLAATADFFFLTTKATQAYWGASMGSARDICLVFGRETRGLPESILAANRDRCFRIPMEGTRSLNLATAVGIVLYEAVRQRAVR
jgi:tRNA (cytidine/uridine-2'-O-)-methyltransferase